MALASIIAHRIYRHSPGSAFELQLRSETFATNGKLEELAYELKTQFIRKGGKSYGRFSDETGEFPLPAWLRDYREERLSFLSFTQKVMQQFQQSLEKAESLLDAYVFFVEEKLEIGDTLNVYLIEHQSGLYLDGELALDDSLALDTSGFTLAAKIQLNDWTSGDSSTYLTLMRARGDKDIADAFTQFIAFTDKQDIKQETAEFLRIVDDFSQTLDEPTAKLTRNKVADYCLEQNKAGKPVTIAALSSNLAEEVKSYEPERFVRYVENSKPDLKPEFIPHAGQIRSYVRISGRNDSLSMSFASECLGREIEYDADNDVLTIKNLPSALKARLLKHLKESHGGN
ncbi:nucleoid-associated protein [Cellvibrio sp. NN19]|uniref:nucleoid-associated protein n=1 Tax=Cellvibrio chitinivorans TaxID=3102792 RepID=UPI002B415E77|nr:nucleoid-associated protein [Cellvibrio sp. NN19]